MIEDSQYKIINTSLQLATSLPSSPSAVSTTVSNALRILSPKTWLGLMQVFSRSPFSEFELEAFVKATSGLLLPILFLLYCTKIVESMRDARPQLQRVLILSPWIWQCFWQFCLQSQRFVSTMISNIQKRNKPLPCAVEELQTRLSNQRAYKTRRYTVYLPPSSTDDDNNEIKQIKIALFFPGALVPSVSYSEVAGRLSDKGLVVVVPSLEPFLLAAPNLGTELEAVCGIMKKVRKELGLRKNHHQIEWCLMGHSMGAFAAMRLYDAFQEGNQDVFIHNKVQLKIEEFECETFGRIRMKDLVLLGVAPFITECTNLSKYNDMANNRILLIQGTDDVLIELLADGIDELYSNFPDATTMQKDIVGATHHGFASYNDQDGQITMRAQKSQVCEHIAEFLQLKR